ncbi:MAG: UvrD-helicase domain-containing protein, partial [Alphaproteobacteria bacterium]|nr:UvrD-helicase domain-containing protein [Alphaproteobacteria bacterium]
ALYQKIYHLAEQMGVTIPEETADDRNLDANFSADLPYQQSKFRRYLRHHQEFDQEFFAHCRQRKVFDEFAQNLPHLQKSSKTTDHKLAERISEFLGKANPSINQNAPRPDDFYNFDLYAAIFLTQKHEPFKTLLTKEIAAHQPNFAKFMSLEQNYLVGVRRRRLALQNFVLSAALLQVGAAIFSHYTHKKQLLNGLDYDDLVALTGKILAADQGANWVHYKLDEGIEHVLVDEAQDTNPQQWRVITGLVDEFFAGIGASSPDRSLFVVGDVKQSIYSFQGADARNFATMREYLKQRASEGQKPWQEVPFEFNFRSVPVILALVDAVFRHETALASLSPRPRFPLNAQTAPAYLTRSEKLSHISNRQGNVGLVELWPLARAPQNIKLPSATDRSHEILAQANEEGAAHFQPIRFWPQQDQIQNRMSPRKALAMAIADRIAYWLEHGTILPAQKRPIRASDILVLLRRRTTHFAAELVTELKKRQVPVAGQDRFYLHDILAIQDILAVARFALLPDDDFNLACLLKSPLIGLTEQDLQELAMGRHGLSLWQYLRQKSERDDAAPRLIHATASLHHWLERADFTTPYEFFAEILSCPHRWQHPRATNGENLSNKWGGWNGLEDFHLWSGRQKILAALGEEARDAMDEFQTLTLTYEQSEPPSLQGFLTWFDVGRPEIKRVFSAASSDDDPSQGRDEVRIMTVHGSKGLQAPIVILPDTASLPKAQEDLYWHEEFGPIWPAASALVDDFTEHVKISTKNEKMAEYYRLLYVALTRAADWLIIGGWCGDKDPDENSWYAVIEQAMAQSYEDEIQPTRLHYYDFRPTGLSEWLGEGWVWGNDDIDEIYQNYSVLASKQESETITEKPEHTVQFDRRGNQSGGPILPDWARPNPLMPHQNSQDFTTPSDHDIARQSETDQITDTPKRDSARERGTILHGLLQLMPEFPPHYRANFAATWLAQQGHDWPAEDQQTEIAKLLALWENPTLAAWFAAENLAEQEIAGWAFGKLHQRRIDRIIKLGDKIIIIDYKTDRNPPRNVSLVPEKYREQLQIYTALVQRIFPTLGVESYLLWTETSELMHIPFSHEA